MSIWWSLKDKISDVAWEVERVVDNVKIERELSKSRKHSELKNKRRQKLNISDNKKVAKGSVLRVRSYKAGVTFDHFGIYAGNRQVIHFAEGVVKQESIDSFTGCAIGNFHEPSFMEITSTGVRSRPLPGSDGVGGESIIEVCAYTSENISKEYTLTQSLLRAKSKLGMTGYDVLLNNCEHFSNWCRLGIPYSSQACGVASPSELKWDSPIKAPKPSEGKVDIVSIARTNSNIFNQLGMAVSRRIYASELK